jgi:hypothetical protein
MDARLCVGIGDADLGLEAIGITEEQTQDRPEIGDEPVGGATRDQPIANDVERFLRSGLEREMIDASTPEHRCLSRRLGVPVDLEHVEFCVRSHVDERQPNPVGLGHVVRYRRTEHLAVEGVQPVGVVGENGHVVHAVEQHRAPDYG